MTAVVWGTFCNAPHQFGLSFYCKGSSSACDVFRNFTAVQCLSQPSQLYCTNQQACSGANFTDDIYIEFPLNGRSASDYDTITRKAFTYNQTISISATKTAQLKVRDSDSIDHVSHAYERATSPLETVQNSFMKAYNGPTNPAKLLINALGSSLFKQRSTGGAASVTALQIKLRDALFAAVRSTTSKAMTQVKQCKEVNATRDGMVSFNNQFIGNITNMVSQNSFATWLLTMFVGHTIANSALVSEIDIVKDTLKSSLSSCSPVTANTTTITTTTTTTTTTPSPSPPPGCDTLFSLKGASESAFNPAGKGFSASLSCAALNVSSIAVLANDDIVTNYTATPSAITFSGFSQPEVLLAIFARDVAGKPTIDSFQLLFGSDTLPVTVYTSSGQPAPNVNVQATATLYNGVTQSGTTNAKGRVQFVNLPGTTVSLVARASDGQLAINGVASSALEVKMTLIPLGIPSNVSNWDFSHGLNGWSGGSLENHVEKRKNLDLTLSTDGSSSLVTSGGTFNAFPFTTRMYVRYRFQTNEVPGGYFGSQYNDYYSVSIRSNTSEYVTVTNSMNALGLGAFDADGYTDWYTLQLEVPKDVPKFGHIDIAVANVADSDLDSQIIVDKAGDIDCDNCSDCSTCPSNPMCQQACTNPPPQSCAFYANCVEATVPCLGKPESYAIDFGDKYCNKYRANINNFSPKAQAFVYGTGQCLQRALIPAVTCGADCPSIRTAAFNSHPKCYIDNGFCDLTCEDYGQVIKTVIGGLVSIPGFRQAFGTGIACLSKPAGFFSEESCGGKLNAKMIDVLSGVFQSLNEEP